MWRLLCCTIVLICFSANLKAQDILNTKDLSTIKVDMLSDEQIAAYKQKLQDAGVSESQAEQLALQKGMPMSEINKLRDRLNNVNTTSTNRKRTRDNTNTGRTYDTSKRNNPYPLFNNEPYKEPYKVVFGSNLFNNNNLTFEPDLRIATPQNYTLGPDDEVVIDVFGYQESNQKLTVTPEGSISVPNVGMVPVAGLSVEQATKRIKDKMIHNGYASIASGQSQLQVSVGKIRSIKVTIIGEAKQPGTYTLPSLATIFNGLYAAGGPADNGSFRTIELIRNSKVIERLDAYDFLLHGDQSHNVRLADQDVIRIPVIKRQVTLKGEVKREGMYEMLPKESLTDLLDFAGGFSSTAYTATIHVQHYTDREKQVKDVTREQFTGYEPQNGDEIEVGKILDRFANRIVISGAIYRPGEYELTNGLTLSQLIAKADGLKTDALKDRGLLIRTNDDLSKQIVSFNVGSIINGSQKDIALGKDDSVHIASINDFKDSMLLTIEGEIRAPGTYQYYIGITLKDLLFQAGGFNDAASVKHIEVARRLNNDSISINNKQVAEVLDVTTEKDLHGSIGNIVLKPWDIVSIRTKPGYKTQALVSIKGEVLYPGNYVLSIKNERVSDLIQRSGGLTAEAFINGANLTRLNNKGVGKDSVQEKLQKIKKQIKDSTDNIAQDYMKTSIKVGLDLQKILNNPGGIEDVILQEGDELTIPMEKREIRISGEVMAPSEIVFKKGEKLDYYIDMAGGYTDNARRKKVYVLYPNGSAARIKHFLFFKRYPTITAGSEILVPQIPERKNHGLSTTEVIGLASAMASLAGVVIALLRL